MKIYLAARFSLRPLMQEVAAALRGRGHEVTSRWIDTDHRWDGEDRERASLLAQEDAEDIDEADALVLFTPPGRRGGCNCEFGIAAGLGKWLYVVGPRQNVFHAHAIAFDTWDEMVDALPLDPFAASCAQAYASDWSKIRWKIIEIINDKRMVNRKCPSCAAFKAHRTMRQKRAKEAGR